MPLELTAQAIPVCTFEVIVGSHEQGWVGVRVCHRRRHTDTHRHTDTQTHRHRHTDTQTHRHTDTRTHRHTDTQTHRRHTDTHKDTNTQRPKDPNTQIGHNAIGNDDVAQRTVPARGAPRNAAAASSILTNNHTATHGTKCVRTSARMQAQIAARREMRVIKTTHVLAT